MMRPTLKTKLSNLEGKVTILLLKLFKKAPHTGSFFESSSHFGSPMDELGLKKQFVSEFDQIFEANR